MNPARIWDELLGKTDREVIHRGGYGARRGVGRRPALLVIDAQYNYFGRDLPILEQIEAWPSGVGRGGLEFRAQGRGTARRFPVRRGAGHLYPADPAGGRVWTLFTAKLRIGPRNLIWTEPRGPGSLKN